MEVSTAFRRAMLDTPAVAGYVQDRVYKRKLIDHVDQTGARALVVSEDGGWTAPNPVNTPAFPLLIIEAWADCTRDHDTRGRPTEKLREDAIDNAWALFRVADAVLHPMARGRRWGAVGSNPGLLVVGGQRWTEPRWYDADRPDGSGRKFGDAAMVTAQYALQVAFEVST